MGQSKLKIQTKLMREYYKYFSKYAKGKAPEQKVAWVTSFTPIEILEALDILYYYPESYAAVIAASEQEQECIEKCNQLGLSLDCCGYSCCIEGAMGLEGGPRGTLPKPDILIATNNQCNTLPNWWNIFAVKYGIPLMILDYPGEMQSSMFSEEYVKKQHMQLVQVLEELSGNVLEEDKLLACIEKSKNSVAAWNRVTKHLAKKDVEPVMLFDGISFLITSRCKELTADLYVAMDEELQELEELESEKAKLFWCGYPLWYHPKRYLDEILEDFKCVGSNYITWWNLDYEGNDVWEMLYHAYNYTFLNLSQKSRDYKLKKLIEESGAECAIVLHNKSCKCDFVSAKNIMVPQAELEIDMIDRNFLNMDDAKKKIELLKDVVCTELE